MSTGRGRHGGGAEGKSAVGRELVPHRASIAGAKAAVRYVRSKRHCPVAHRRTGDGAFDGSWGGVDG